MSGASTAVLCLVVFVGLAVAGDLSKIEAMVQERRLEDASRALEAWERTRPDVNQLHCRLGRLYYQVRALQKAVKSLAACLNQSPNDWHAHQVLGFTLIALHRPDLAEREFLRAIRINPASADSHYGLGRIQYERGAYSDAVDSLAHAVRLAPAAWAMHQSLGLAYEAVNDVDSAHRHLIKALELNQVVAEQDAWPYINLAAFHNRRGQYKDALAFAAKSLALLPASEVARFQAAKAYCGLRMWTECKHEIQSAIQLDGTTPEFFYILATAQRSLGEHALAKASLRRFGELKRWESTGRPTEAELLRK